MVHKLNKKILICLMFCILFVQFIVIILINKENNNRAFNTIEEASQVLTVKEVKEKLSSIKDVEICSIKRENNNNIVILRIINEDNEIKGVLKELKEYNIENYSLNWDGNKLILEITLLI